LIYVLVTVDRLEIKTLTS